MTEVGRPYEFDVALSYAGENRLYVHEVANYLRAKNIRVFYDEFFTAELWGQDLYSYLDAVYRERSRFTVVFISQSYVSKPWPSHERQSAQARALAWRPGCGSGSLPRPDGQGGAYQLVVRRGARPNARSGILMAWIRVLSVISSWQVGSPAARRFHFTSARGRC